MTAGFLSERCGTSAGNIMDLPGGSLKMHKQGQAQEGTSTTGSTFTAQHRINQRPGARLKADNSHQKS